MPQAQHDIPRRVGVAPWMPWIIPPLVLLAATLPHLQQGSFRKDTGRYAGVALQALENGFFWTLRFTPDRPYFNKPPLVFWIHGLVLDAFGTSLVAVRLPTIIAALIALLATVAIVRTLGSRRAALATGIVLSLTYEYFRRTREISLDMWQLAFMMLAMLMIVRGVRAHRATPVALSGLFIGLALMTKPFIALLVLPIALAWMLVAGARRLTPWLLASLALALLVASPWHVSMWLLHGDAFLDQYLSRQVLNRAQGEINPQGLWFYPTLLLKTYWPWIIPALLAAIVWIRSPRRLIVMGVQKRLLVLSLLWLLAWAGALMAFPDKRPRYTPPIYPALAILAGSFLSSSPTLRVPVMAAMTRAWIPALILAPIIAVLPIRFQAPDDPEWTAAFEWLRRQNVREIHTLGINTNEQGWYRVEMGVWPTSLADEMLDRAQDPPPGTLVLIRNDAPDPPVGELLWSSDKGRLRILSLR